MKTKLLHIIAEIPASFTAYLVGALIIFFSGIANAMFATGIIIVIDTVSGVWASKRHGEKFESRKFGNLLSKLVLYQLLIISAHSIDMYMIETRIFVPACLIALSGVEFASIVENIDKATGVNLWDYLKNTVKRPEK